MIEVSQPGPTVGFDVVSGEELQRWIDVIRRSGVETVHAVAWRDLEDPDAGGSERHAEEVFSRWADAGLRIHMRTSHALGRPERTRRGGLDVTRRGGRMTVFPRGVAAEVLRRPGHGDALVEIWNGMPWMSPWWWRGPRLVIFHHVHGPMWNQILPAPIAALGRTLESSIAPRFYRRSTVVTPSEATRGDLVGLGMPPERVHAVDNGVDAFFTPDERGRGERPTVVAVGRLAPVKRFELVIDACVRARERVPTLELRIVGEGPLLGDLEAQVARCGARDWITFTGRLDRDGLRAEYRRAWLVTSGSLAEGWGLSLTEAGACATPAVATDIGGHRCSVIDGTTGVLVDPEGLGSALADVLLDHDRRHHLGTAARERAAQLTWDATASGIAAVFASEVRQWARPPSSSGTNDE